MPARFNSPQTHQIDTRKPEKKETTKQNKTKISSSLSLSLTITLSLFLSFSLSLSLSLRRVIIRPSLCVRQGGRVAYELYR